MLLLKRFGDTDIPRRIDEITDSETQKVWFDVETIAGPAENLFGGIHGHIV